MNLYADRFRSVQRDFGARTAIVDRDGAHSYAAFSGRVARLANALLGLGLQPGDRVASVQRDTRQHLESVHALLLAGLVRVPLNPALTSAEMRAQIAGSGARAMLYDEGIRDAVRDAVDETDVEELVEIGGGAPGARPYEQLLAAAQPAPPRAKPPHDALALLSYSGGTTGKPKAVALSVANLLAAVDNAVGVRPVEPGDVFLNVRPIWPIASIILTFQLLSGATLVLGGKFDPSTFLSLLCQVRATTSSLVPTQLIRLLEEAPPGPVGAPQLRLIDCGGAAIPLPVFRDAIERFGPRIGVLYGLTEAPWTCYLPPAEIAAAPADAMEDVLTSVGRPIPGYEVLIVDDVEGDVIPPGGVGEITIRGANVMQGYWQMPEESAAALRDGRLRTGDLGRIDEAGRLHVTGRLKEVIRSGAMSINPREVEDVLLEHPAVAEAAVFGVPDAVWGEAVRAAVVRRAGHAVTEEELATFVRSRLAGYKKPQRIEFRDSLPRTHYGKIVKRELVREPSVPQDGPRS